MTALKFIALFFFFSVLLIGGCDWTSAVRDKSNSTSRAVELEKISDLKLPVSAKILAVTDERGRDGTKFQKWLVLSSERPILLGTTAEDDNKSFIKSLKEALPNENVGRPLNDKYQFSVWHNAHGQWQAALIETDQGFYLDLENIILN